MEKSAGKTSKRSIRAKISPDSKNRAKLAEYVNCLLELHKLQGTLLTELKKTTP